MSRSIAHKYAKYLPVWHKFSARIDFVGRSGCVGFLR